MTIEWQHENQLMVIEIIRRKGQKQMIIKPPIDGIYTMSVPKNASKKVIFKMLEENANQLLKMPQLQSFEMYLSASETIDLLGNSMPVMTVQSTQNRVTINQYLLIETKDNNQRVNTLKAYLKTCMLKQINVLENKYLHQINKDISKLNYEFRYLKNSFGICKPKRNIIVFNLALVHYPKQYIDYVYAHEIAHLVHLNHGADFYQLLTTLFPNHRAIKRDLNAYHQRFMHRSTS